MAAVIAAFFGIGGDHYLMIETLSRNRHELMAFVHQYGFAAVVAFMAIYVCVAAFPLPGASVLTIAGGFLFGPWWGTLWITVAATAGATLLFLVARTTLGDGLQARAGPALQKMEAGFRANAFSYLLSLRLIPVFPFFLVNLVPAFLGVPLATFVAATAIGIIPGTIVFVVIGAGLGGVFDMMMEFSLAAVLTPDIIAGLVGLAVLSLMPVLIGRLRARTGAAVPPER